MSQEKFSTSSGILIYKNYLKESDKIFDILKDTESLIEPFYLFNPWSPWQATWYGSAMTINGSYWNDLPTKNEKEDIKITDQRYFFESVYNAYINVLKDYVESNKEKNIWPNFIKNWDIEQWTDWKMSGISCLKYDPQKSNHDPKNGIYDLPMNFHTDTNQEDLDSPGDKMVITVTMYLNDDYKGGEISLYDAPDDLVYNYKPKSGDITVFPSFHPYYHGVLPFDDAPRYLLRMFLSYEYPGSDSWFQNEEKYGKEKWLEMEKQRLHDVFMDRKHNRRIVLPEYKTDGDHYENIIVHNDPIRIE